jgi:hypothetical protein
MSHELFVGFSELLPYENARCTPLTPRADAAHLDHLEIDLEIETIDFEPAVDANNKRREKVRVSQVD